MIPRGFILAVQFLTRLPTPQVSDFMPEDLARSAVWFPAVGLLIGTIVGLAVLLGAQVDPWLGGLLGLLAWVWVTGALHLDGLGDSADALGAAHRDPERFLAVLKDPHVGSFGVVAIVLQLLAKLVLLMLLAAHGGWFLLPLVCAWARFGPIMWTLTLPALAPGSGERFGWTIGTGAAVAWAAALTLPSLWSIGVLAAPAAIVAWRLYLKRRLGGQTGDLLGAGVELVESAALLALVVAVAL
jgi:adenosylcobinamide-GDP ribazoletransferase